MQREQKVGFTILILIVGFTGAFCFRRQPEGEVAFPVLQDESELNQLIAQYRLRPLLPGIDTDETLNPQRQFEQYLAANIPGKKLEPLEKQKVPKPIQPFVPLASDRASSQTSHALSGTDRGHGNEHITRSTEAVPANFRKNKPTGKSRIHVVQPGETLSGIAQKYLGSASRFNDIYNANRNILSGPNQLKPHMKLVIPSGKAETKKEIIKQARKNSEPAVSSTKKEKNTKGKPSDKKGGLPEKSDSPGTSLAGAEKSSKPGSAKKLFVPMRHSPFSNKTKPTKNLAKQPDENNTKLN